MIDTVRINIKAGNGGNGCTSFLRQKYKPKGGPDGGDGGNGGSIYITADTSINTLLHLKYNSTFYAERGQHGKGKDKKGQNGRDTHIKVPIGTVVWRLEEDGTKQIISDVKDQSPRLLARGGRGGWGNARYVSPTNQEPMLSQKGEEGEKVVLFLELKLLADVGLLAKPNAGKSTLISACSAARPKVAEYPFTTIEPVLGVVTRQDKDFVMMEIPGLIEGAHQGTGLGHQFLRHAERARLYIHLLDGLSEDPIEDFKTLNHELLQFNQDLAAKPQIVAINKIDTTEVQQRQADLKAQLTEVLKQYPDIVPPGCDQVPLFLISAATGQGVDLMLNKTIELLDAIPKETQAEEVDTSIPESRRQRPRSPETFHLEQGVYVIDSPDLERLTAMADTRDYKILLQIWREMTRRGIARQLEEAGIEPGDTIRIGKREMEWF